MGNFTGAFVALASAVLFAALVMALVWFIVNVL